MSKEPECHILAFTTFTDGSIKHDWKGHLPPLASPLPASDTGEAAATEDEVRADE